VSTKAPHPTLKRAFSMLAVGTTVGIYRRRLESTSLPRGLAWEVGGGAIRHTGIMRPAAESFGAMAGGPRRGLAKPTGQAQGP
jgi:hypothetical protein